MRVGEEEERLVVSFAGSTDAQIFAASTAEEKISGRLIPKPREFSADCGQAFMSALENESAIKQLIEDKALDYEEIRLIKFRV